MGVVSRFSESKVVMCWVFPSSSNVKSSAFRSCTGLPCLSRATTLTRTSSVSTLMRKAPCWEVFWDCGAGVWAEREEKSRATIRVIAITRYETRNVCSNDISFYAALPGRLIFRFHVNSRLSFFGLFLICAYLRESVANCLCCCLSWFAKYQLLTTKYLLFKTCTSPSVVLCASSRRTRPARKSATQALYQPR